MARVKDSAYWRDYRARRAARGDPVRRDKPSRRKHEPYSFTDVLMTLVVDEVSSGGYAALARATFIDRQSVAHWCIGRNGMTSLHIDVLVDYFGWERIRARRSALRSLMATTEEHCGPADIRPRVGPWLPPEKRPPGKHPWRASIRG